MRVDWFRVITDLERAGVSLRAQSSAADVSLGTVAYWKNGGQPKHYNGQLLLHLYSRTFGSTSAPIQATLAST